MKSIRYIFILALSLCVTATSNAQAQLQWIYARTYNEGPFQTGTFVQSRADQNGGIYFTASTDDTVCFYNLAQLERINPSGNQSWRTEFFYETPCLSQSTNSLCVHKAGIYTAIFDTSGHLVRLDTSGSIILVRDTLPIASFGLLSQDQTGNIVSVVFPQTTSSLISHDSLLNVRWTYSPTYPFVCDFKKMLCDKTGNRIALFDYNDNTQTETLGIGLMKLDTNGTLIWDTFINPQLTPADPDWCVDAEIDNNGNIYVLSEDNNQGGVYLHKVDASGNIIASTEYVIPAPLVDPKDIELDTLHGLVYVTGRKTGTIVRLKYDFNLNPLDTLWVVTQANGKFAQKTNEYGYFYQWWIMQNAGVKELHLDMYNHGGQLVDSYTYWDSTRFQNLYPEQIVIDTLGNIFGICSADDTAGNDAIAIFKFINPLGIHSELSSNNEILVFPNPASESVTVNFPLITGHQVISLFNTSGQRVFTDSFSGQTFTINTASFQSGLYFIEVATETGIRLTHNLIIQH